MTYELVITRTQPHCGGKSPQTHEIRSVDVTDILAYVRRNEKDLPADFPLKAYDNGKGTISVDFESGKSHVTYEFTED